MASQIGQLLEQVKACSPHDSYALHRNIRALGDAVRDDRYLLNFRKAELVLRGFLTHPDERIRQVSLEVIMRDMGLYADAYTDYCFDVLEDPQCSDDLRRSCARNLGIAFADTKDPAILALLESCRERLIASDDLTFAVSAAQLSIYGVTYDAQAESGFTSPHATGCEEAREALQRARAKARQYV